MIYTPRSQSVEAAPVELAGQRLMAVAVDGKAHLVDASVFETLFESRPSTPVEDVAAAIAAVAGDCIEPTHMVVRPENLKKALRYVKNATSASMRRTVKKSKEPPPPKPAADGPVSPREGSRAEKCMETLRVHGPLTTAELRDHVFDDLLPAKRLMNFSDLSIRMRKAKQIERREDPTTHLDKWHLCEGV